MMLSHMEYIYAVYQAGSFSKAARELYVSQPWLSSIVKKAELEIGLPIFNRQTTPLTLTEAGKYYIENISVFLDIQKRMQQHFSEMGVCKEEKIHIGSSMFFCAHVLPSMVAGFQEKHPNTRILLSEVSVSNLEKAVGANQIDFLLTVEMMDRQLFESVTWDHEDIVLAVPADLAVNERLEKFRFTHEELGGDLSVRTLKPAVSMQKFAEEKFLFLQEGNDIYARGLKMCQNAGFVPQISFFIDQMLTGFHCACEGHGIAFIREPIVHYIPPTHKVFFYRIDDPLVNRSVYLSYLRTNELTAIHQHFLNFMSTKKIIATPL